MNPENKFLAISLVFFILLSGVVIFLCYGSGHYIAELEAKLEATEQIILTLARECKEGIKL